MAEKKFKTLSGPTIEMFEALTGKRPPSGYEDTPENKLKVKKWRKQLAKEFSKYPKVENFLYISKSTCSKRGGKWVSGKCKGLKKTKFKPSFPVRDIKSKRGGKVHK